MIIQTDKQLEPRHEHDFYETPIEFCRSTLKALVGDKFTGFACDPGCGSGNWGKALREISPKEESVLIGIDTRDVGELEGYDKVHHGDYQYLFYPLGFDLIIGNPPFKQAEDFIKKSMELLRDNGTLIFLLRLSFLEGVNRGRNLFKEHRPSEVLVSMSRISWTGNGKSDDTAYAVFKWVKGKEVTETKLGWLDWKAK